MSVISTWIEPHRVTRVFFDCRDTMPNPAHVRLFRGGDRTFVRPTPG